MSTNEARLLLPEGVIFFVQANSCQQVQLDVKQELRDIQRALGRRREQLDVVPDPSLDELYDIIKIDEGERPIFVIHFSGHGTRDGGFGLVKQDGSSEYVGLPNLDDWFASLADSRKLSCIYFSACHAGSFVIEIAQKVRCVVASDGEVGDEAARDFSKYFYTSLVAESSAGDVQKAFADAKAKFKGRALRGSFRLFMDGRIADFVGSHGSPAEPDPQGRSSLAKAVFAVFEALGGVDEQRALLELLVESHTAWHPPPLNISQWIEQALSFGLFELTHHLWTAMRVVEEQVARDLHRDHGERMERWVNTLRDLYEELAPQVEAGIELCDEPSNGWIVCSVDSVNTVEPPMAGRSGRKIKLFDQPPYRPRLALERDELPQLGASVDEQARALERERDSRYPDPEEFEGMIEDEWMSGRDKSDYYAVIKVGDRDDEMKYAQALANRFTLLRVVISRARSREARERQLIRKMRGIYEKRRAILEYYELIPPDDDKE